MVGSCDVRFPIQLEGLCLTHTQFSTYEPELFPGLIYRMVKPRVVLLIFVSGKVSLKMAWFKRSEMWAREKRFMSPKILNLKGHLMLLSLWKAFWYTFFVVEHKLIILQEEVIDFSIFIDLLKLEILRFFQVVITGAKYKKDIDDAFNQIYPILKGFKK